MRHDRTWKLAWKMRATNFSSLPSAPILERCQRAGSECERGQYQLNSRSPDSAQAHEPAQIAVHDRIACLLATRTRETYEKAKLQVRMTDKSHLTWHVNAGMRCQFELDRLGQGCVLLCNFSHGMGLDSQSDHAPARRSGHHLRIDPMAWAGCESPTWASNAVLYGFTRVPVFRIISR